MTSSDYHLRIEALTEDNAFVNVLDVLKPDTQGSDRSSDMTSPFLEREDKGKRRGPLDFRSRVNISAALSEQHRSYLQWIKTIPALKHKRHAKTEDRRGKLLTLKRENIALDDKVAVEAEEFRELGVLEAWKREMLSGNTDGADESVIQLLTACPSFEAMTAPCIARWAPTSSKINKKNREEVEYGMPLAHTINGGMSRQHLCGVCLLPASYRCSRCRRSLFCSSGCFKKHDSTRCMKFTI